MGAATDLENEGLRRLIVNAVYWGLGMRRAAESGRHVRRSNTSRRSTASTASARGCIRQISRLARKCRASRCRGLRRKDGVAISLIKDVHCPAANVPTVNRRRYEESKNRRRLIFKERRRVARPRAKRSPASGDRERMQVPIFLRIVFRISSLRVFDVSR